MRLSTYLDTPLVVSVDGNDWHIPRFTLADFANWQSNIESERRAEVTRGLSPAQRYAIMRCFDDGGVTLEDLRARVFTASGAAYVLGVCLAKMKLGVQHMEDSDPKERDAARKWAEGFSRKFDGLDAKTLAATLAGVIDPARPLIEPDAEGEQGSDPSMTTTTGTIPTTSSPGGSKTSGGTGASSSPASTTPTPVSNRDDSPSDGC